MTINNNKNGGLFTYTHYNNKVVGVVSLSCETDFAEKTAVFKLLGENLAMQVACSDVDSVNDFVKLECYTRDGGKTVQAALDEVSKLLKEKVELLKISKIVF